MHQFDVEVPEHHRCELGEVSVAARRAVPAGRVDLELDPHLLFPEGGVLVANHLPDLAQVGLKVRRIRRLALVVDASLRGNFWGTI